MQDIQTLEQEQLARQFRAEKRAEETHKSNERKLKEIGKESALIYGRKLYGLLIVTEYLVNFLIAAVILNSAKPKDLTS